MRWTTKIPSWSAGALLGVALLSRTAAQSQGRTNGNSPVIEVIGVKAQLANLAGLEQQGLGDSIAALTLRNRILQSVLLASFDVDDTLARIDAEVAHADDSRSVLAAQKGHRDTALNTTTFALSGVLGTTGSAMQLTRGLNHAGNALNIAAGAAAVSLSIVQLSSHGKKRVLLSPYNMLAEVLDQTPNAQSQYPAVVKAYLAARNAEDGQLPDAAPPQESLRKAWYRLHRLQADGGHTGSSLLSATTDSTHGVKLSMEELTDREAMLRDLHGTVALLKNELRAILLALQPGL